MDSEELKKAIKEEQKRLGSIGGKKTKKLYGDEHYQKLAENMNHKREVKKQAALALELGESTQGLKKPTQPLMKKQKEVKKGELPDSMKAFAEKLRKRAEENKDGMGFS